VLQHGGTLHGRITREGDRYIVSLGEGREIRLPVGQVELECRDLEHAYRLKHATIRQSSAREHLDLAEWCLRHDLLHHVADHLLEAMAIDPKHPRIAPLEHRLRLATEPVPAVQRRAAQPDPHVATEDIEREVATMPLGTVEKFTTAVQPILLNRCSTAVCHGTASKSRFRLRRPPWGPKVTRPFTLRNLHATLKMIDHDHPEKSPLLMVPMAAHGTVKGAVFDEHQSRQLQRLSAWVDAVTRTKTVSQPTSVEKPESLLFRTPKSGQSPLPLQSPQDATPLVKDDPKGSGQVRLPADSPRGSRTPTRTPQRGALSSQPAPKDPFDPAVFNRRYHQQGE